MKTNQRILEFQEMINITRKSLKELNYLILDNEKISHDKINSLRYRGLEFNNNNILVLGCSQTWGYAMDYEHMWSTILGNKLNKEISNIAIPGDSLQSQVVKAFSYFKEIGNPKIIIGLLPFARFEFPYIKNKTIFKTMQPQKPLMTKTNSYIGNAYVPYELDKDENYITYTKTPHNMDEIFNIEMAMFYNDIFISILEQYCKSHDIKLIWSFWENLDDNINKIFCNTYKDYFAININRSLEIIRQKIKIFNYKKIFQFMYLCKNEYFSSLVYEYKDHPYFNIAKDNNHFGILANIYIADEFYNELKNRFDIE